MENKVLISRAIRYQKTASDNMFSILATLQGGSEKMVEETLNQCAWFPESGKKGLGFWYDTCTKTSDNLKQMIDHSYEEVQKYFDSSEVQSQPVEKTVQSAATTVKKAQPVPVRKKQPAKPKPAVARTKTAVVRKTTTSKAAPATTGTVSKSIEQKPASVRKAATKVATSPKSTPADKGDNNKSSAEPKTTTITSAKVPGAEK